MNTAISIMSIQQLFTAARTHHAWQDRDIADELLQEIYDLAKWGPTSANSLPMRIVFVKSNSAKEKLMPALAGSNVEQVRAAPVTAIVAYDQKFYDQLPTLFPAFDAGSLFASNPSLSEQTAFRNSSLQRAYFILAARALVLIKPASLPKELDPPGDARSRSGDCSDYLADRNLPATPHPQVFADYPDPVFGILRWVFPVGRTIL